MIKKIIKFVHILRFVSTVKKSHICVLCSGGKILCYGVNSERTRVRSLSLLTEYHFLSLHAEFDAIRRYLNKQKKKKIDMYVIRIHKDGRFSNSKPCNKCQELIYKCDLIRRVFYTNTEGGFSRLT